MSLTFALSKPLVNYHNLLKEWSVAECRPYAREVDTNHLAPDNWRDVLASAPVPIGQKVGEHSGPKPQFEEGHWVADLVFHEALIYGDIWPMPLLGRGIGHLVVAAMGTPEQVERWYKPVAAGEGRAAIAITEPGFGSDTSMVATTATRDGDRWVLNGSKIYCSSATTSTYITVFATVDKSLGAKGIAAFVVPAGTPGLVITKPNESKLGIRSWMTSAFSLDDCAVPIENRLGWVDDPNQTVRASGQSGALSALSNNRPNISAIAIAMAQASIDCATDILRERRHGFAVQRWSAIENEMHNMNAALDRGRRVNFAAQFPTDSGVPDRMLPAMAKAFSPQTAERVIRRCMQMLGPDGTSTELLLEKWYRDSKILDIFEGSGQVLRVIVARSLMGRAAG